MFAMEILHFGVLEFETYFRSRFCDVVMQTWFIDTINTASPNRFISPSRPQEHRQSHGNTREPLLENITSEYDLELFRKAQARASEDLVRQKPQCTFVLHA